MTVPLPSSGSTNWYPWAQQVDGQARGAAPQTSLDALAASIPEAARDALGAALVAGTNVTITPNDGADTITISATVPSSYSDEQAQDAFAALIAAGTHSGISFSYNDAGNALSATVTAATASDATTTAKGIVQLAGDLGGTASSPTVPGKTALTVNGTFQSTYDLDTTPVTPADIGAEQTANKNVANGYAGLNAFSQVLIGNLPTGNGAGNVTVGNDSRLSDTRTPTDGTVTDAKVASGAAIAESKLSLASDAVAGTASRRTLGTGAQQAAAGNDSRITGATQKASNLSDLASASTARTNLGLATVAATGSYTDLSNTPTIPAAYTDEQARDALGAALVAGANVTITVNDAADTITVAASGGLTSAQAAGRALILGS